MGTLAINEMKKQAARAGIGYRLAAPHISGNHNRPSSSPQFTDDHRAKTIKSCDLQGWQAGQLFALLNWGRVEMLVGCEALCHERLLLYTDVEPSELIYPEG